MTDRENLAREVAERLGLTLEGHTPGPWHLCENFRIFDPPNDVIFAAHVEDAIVCSMGENLPECKANARLIASSPTLWNALLDSEEKRRKTVVDITSAHRELLTLQAKLDDSEEKCRELEQKLNDEHRVSIGEVWHWQGGEEDHLESLNCPILISPEKLRAALSGKG